MNSIDGFLSFVTLLLILGAALIMVSHFSGMILIWVLHVLGFKPQPRILDSKRFAELNRELVCVEQTRSAADGSTTYKVRDPGVSPEEEAAWNEEYARFGALKDAYAKVLELEHCEFRQRSVKELMNLMCEDFK